jgi:hypothetical protein
MTTITTAPLHIIGNQRVLDIRGNPGKLGYVRTGDLFVTESEVLELRADGHLWRANADRDELLARMYWLSDVYEVQEDLIAATRDGF